MSTGSPLDDKELVRQAIDIVELISSHIQLRRQGRNYVALCPWHDDTRPSLQVNPERQSFKCWVCDIGGDVFSFIMKMEGVTFPEALEMLADRAGIQLRRAARGSSAPDKTEPGSASDKRTLYQAMTWAEAQYHDYLLNSPQAEAAREYLARRNISRESIERFRLGLSPEGRDWILRQAGGAPKRAKILEAIGLLARPSEGGSYYDRFRARLLFSIHDAQGRAVGFGGRVLPGSSSTSPAKYINSPETPLFSKSNLLYGLDVAREPMRKSRTALVMEGYTDVIVAHQYGFGDAVAVLGTALGDGHIRILKRFADRIVLVLDGDEAGQRRANEVLELFVAQQADLRILTLPEGTDPCDFLHEFGAEAFTDLLENRAVDALEHAFQSATRGVDLQRDVHAASQSLERLLSIIARAPRLRHDTTMQDRLREEKVLQRLAARFRVDEQEVRRRLTSLRRQQQQRRLRPAISAPDAAVPDDHSSLPPEELDPSSRELLEILVGYPECWPSVRAEIDADSIAPGAHRRIYETSCRLSDEGIVPDFDRLMLEFDQPAIKSLLVELDEAGRAKRGENCDPQPLLRQLIENSKRKEIERRRPAQIVALREGELDDSQKTAMLERILRQEQDRQGISRPTDG